MEQDQADLSALPDAPAIPTVERRTFLVKGCLALLGVTIWNRTLAAESASLPATYIVKPGDTLSGIALRHGLTLSKLKKINHLTSDTIYPRQELKLVEGKDTFTRLKPILEKIDQPTVSSGWKNIILHHSATPYGNAAIFHRYHLQERHMENGLAYHFVIGNGSNSRNGQVEVGVRWRKQLAGGHVASQAYNETSIGICLVGNFQVKRPSSFQLESARQLVTYLRDYSLKKDIRFLVHKEIEKTLCPGKYFPVSDFHQQFG